MLMKRSYTNQKRCRMFSWLKKFLHIEKIKKKNPKNALISNIGSAKYLFFLEKAKKNY